MKTIKMLFLLTGLSISSIGFGMEDSNADNRVAKELSLDSKTELDKRLIQAIKNSNSELVISLLNRGADKDCEDKNSSWKESALFLAVKDSRTQCDGANEDETIVRILLDQGASVNKTTGPYNWTALHRAAYIGRPNAVRLLLEKGANFNLSIKGFDARTPLRLAQIGFNETKSTNLKACKVLERWPHQVAQEKRARITLLLCGQRKNLMPDKTRADIDAGIVLGVDHGLKRNILIFSGPRTTDPIPQDHIAATKI